MYCVGRVYPDEFYDRGCNRDYTSVDEVRGHAPMSRSYWLTGYQDTASSLVLLAASSSLPIPSRPATWRNSTTIPSEAPVGSGTPAVPIPTLQQAPETVMIAALGASTGSPRSQSMAVVGMFQPGSTMPEDDWNGTTTQAGGFPWAATCPTEQLDVSWAISKTVQLHSRTGYAQVGRAFLLHTVV